MSAKKNKPKASVTAEKYLPPDMESLELNENFLFNSSLNNDFTTVCGAIDAKDHPLTAYMVENNLFNKRNDFGKNFCDLAALLGNKEFLRTIFERSGDKLDDNVFNLRAMLSPNNNYNFMHYACIWGRLDLCKFLIDSSKLISDPADFQIDLSTNSQITIATNNNNKDKDTKTNMKTLGCILLKSKTKTGETPLALAKRYNHVELIDYLNYAEKRQLFIENTNEIKLFINDPEKNLNKLTKDDKKKLEKLYIETMDWIEKNKQNADIVALDVKIKEVEENFRPIVDAIKSSASRLA